MRFAHVESLEERRLLSFTVVAIGDQQYMTEAYPEKFAQMTQWIADNAASRNIVFATQLGDITRRGFSDSEMANADAAMDKLDGVVPYSVSMGNHDYDAQFDSLDYHYSSANFVQWFGASRFAGQSWYGGSSLDGRDSYQVFTGDGRQYLHLNLEWDAPDSAIAWGQSVINAHRNLPVILSTHEYLSGNSFSGPSAKDGGNGGQAIFNKLVKVNPQIFLVLSGHTASQGTRTDTNDAGSTVWEFVGDYSAKLDGGDGRMQLITLDPANNQLLVQVYSPLTGAYSTTWTYSLNFNTRFSFADAGTPIVSDDTFSALPGSFIGGNVLANDDANGADSIAAALVSDVSHGLLALGANGDFAYTPAPGFHGTDSFTYRANSSAIATVTLHVNDAPVAADDTATTPQDIPNNAPLIISPLANDSDPNYDAITPILVSLPNGGTVTPQADGTFAYVPNPKFVGVDTFTYKVSDGVVTGNVVTVTVGVTPNAPVYNYAVSERHVYGSVSGTYTATQAADNIEQTLTERLSSSRNDIEHYYTFNVTPGTDITFVLKAHRSRGNEECGFYWSTDGVNFPSSNYMFTMPRILWDARHPYQTKTLPPTTSGTIYIRVTDNVSSGDTSADSLYIDEMFIRSGVAAPSVSIAATDPSASEVGPDAATFTVTRSGSLASPLVVPYTLTGTASNGEDFQTLSGTVTIPASAASATFSITPIADSLVEGNETVLATLSASADYTIGTSAATVAIADSAPAGLRAAPISSTRIDLAWTDNTSNENGFRIERSTNGVDFALLSNAAVENTWSDTTVAAGATYYYRVRAFTADGLNSAWSAVASARTDLPAAPTGLSATVASKRRVQLSWRDNSTNESGFRVYYSKDGVDFTLLSTVAARKSTGGTVSYTTSSLAAGTWYFRVSAYNAAGESLSSVISVLV